MKHLTEKEQMEAVKQGVFEAFEPYGDPRRFPFSSEYALKAIQDGAKEAMAPCIPRITKDDLLKVGLAMADHFLQSEQFGKLSSEIARAVADMIERMEADG